MTGPVGLRRFAQLPTQRSRETMATAGPTAARATREAEPERCELCGTPVDVRHNHVCDLDHRRISCTCRACYLLFTAPGAVRGRYRAVPNRVHHDPANPLTRLDWEALQVPVGTAFFFTNSTLGRVVGSYPSPAGATECELDLSEWERLAATHPLLRSAAPDVEAILVHRDGSDIEALLVPIDACYELVGQVRLRWRGLDGGAEVRGLLEGFLAGLRERSTPLPEPGRT